MKTLIVAMNSKYIHTSLAPWYLKAACDEALCEIIVKEFTINENIEVVLAAIYHEKPDIVALSCYIWNISHMLRLAENLKQLLADVVIIIGGPEVSFDSEELLQSKGYIDYVISGEGELPFSYLIKCIALNNMDKLSVIAGLTYRDYSRKVVCNPVGKLLELADMVSPYLYEMLSSIKGKIAYYEASRGCPYMCSYCLSSTTRNVRVFPLDNIKRDIIKLVEAEVRQVKFVDRTFNCNKERAKEILSFLVESFSSNRSVNFHFEAAADLFDEEMMQILTQAPVGLFQLEIGVQTINEQSLEAVNRKTDTDLVCKNVSKLLAPGNIHIHLDLIAGLPYEDFNSFRKSFDKVYSLKPHTIQLGFLKLLKGTAVRKDSGMHGYVYRSYAPYEILYNNYISYAELTALKGIEELVDKYYNAGRFKNSLEYIIECHTLSPFDFYNGFRRYISDNKHDGLNMSSNELYTVLFNYCATFKDMDLETVRELIKFDFLATDNSKHLLAFFDREYIDGFQDKCFGFLKNEAMINKYLPEFKGIPSKQVIKKVHFEIFRKEAVKAILNSNTLEPFVVMFDYSTKNPVTGTFKYQIVDQFKL